MRPGRFGDPCAAQALPVSAARWENRQQVHLIVAVDVATRMPWAIRFVPIGAREDHRSASASPAERTAAYGPTDA